MAEDAASRIAEHVINSREVAETAYEHGAYFHGPYKPLTPAMGTREGRLGVNLTRVPPGKTACPFHAHQIEDEVFYVLSGHGVFRYGDELRKIGPGDCISCPAGSGMAHQLANPFNEDLIYLAIGMNDRNEVCSYPDSGKIMVRSLHKTGFLQTADYYAGEPDTPRIFALAEAVRS